MLILPAIDLIGGRTVRLTEGNYDIETDYQLDPVEVAVSFEAAGAEWLHLVDLDGARLGRPANLAVLSAIRDRTSLRIEFGGGLRDEATIEAALEAGAHRVVLGSRLAKDPAFAREVFARYGEQIVAGIDTREGRVAVSGWKEMGPQTGVELAQALVACGAKRVITTDIARDGALIGVNLEWMREMGQAVSVPVIASGGVTTLDDVRALKELAAPGVEGVIIGKALYEGRFTLAEALAL